MMQGKKIRACDFYLRGFLYLDLFSASVCHFTNGTVSNW
jgi:hypothetical protein